MAEAVTIMYLIGQPASVELLETFPGTILNPGSSREVLAMIMGCAALATILQPLRGQTPLLERAFQG